MTRAEITAYMLGAALTREALQLVADGKGDQIPSKCIIHGDQQAALDRLGLDRFNYWMLGGGRDVLAESREV